MFIQSDASSSAIGNQFQGLGGFCREDQDQSEALVFEWRIRGKFILLH